MSTRYPGGVITKTPVVPAGPYETGAAPGIWTLDQQLQAQKAGIWPLAGNLPLFIEDVFSTYLYDGNWAGTGNTNTVTVNNGIDLTGKGGLVWFKQRANTGTIGHALFDTVRGANMLLSSDGTAAQYDYSGAANSFRESMAFASNGFSVTKTAIAAGNGYTNYSGGATYASWTFREQPKFFDVVTFTGNSVAGRQIPHNLNSVPGMILLKSTNVSGPWYVYHRSDPTKYGVLNTTAAFSSFSAQTVFGNNTTTVAPTSTVFTVGTDSTVNNSGDTYVAYLFAHDAGGFGLTGTDNVISCGSLSASALTTVTLGYEPQWVMVKKSSGTGDWYMLDVMRGMSQTTGFILEANLSAADFDGGQLIVPTATGFNFNGTNFGSTSGETFIYIAIRRGPMKVPTDATKVYNAVARTGNSTVTDVSCGFPPDMLFVQSRDSSGLGPSDWDRLRGANRYLNQNNTNAEGTTTNAVEAFGSTGVTFGIDNNYLGVNRSPYVFINWFFRRAPGFFDEVCYTGTGVARTVTHNLAAVPEMMIVKMRSSAGYNWFVYHSALGNSFGINLNSTNGSASYGTALWNSTTPTSTVFSLGTNLNINSSGNTFVNYLFATCPGVSKVGSYTGNGTTQTIDCGFGAGGVRFVLIKRTDAVGGWYVYDTARGMTVLTDPYLFLNSTAAEVATLGSVTTVSTGFALNSAILADINVNAGTYIFLAIA